MTILNKITNKLIGELVDHPVRYFISNMLLLFSACIAHLPHLFLILFLTAFITTLNFLCYASEQDMNN